MTPNEVHEFLQLRLKHDQNTKNWNAEALRIPCYGGLDLGAYLTSDGWTLDELDAAPGYRSMGERDGWAAALSLVEQHWAVEWQRQDDVAKALKLAQEQQRAAAKARQQAEAHARERRARSDAWLASGVPDGLRLDAVVHVEGKAYFTTCTARADALEKVRNHPWSCDEADDREYLNLAVLGPPGTGKSLLSAVWLHRHMMDGCTGRFIDARSLVRRMSDLRKRDSVLEEFTDLAHLVIDDVLVENEDCEAASVSALVELLNARSAAGVPTCFSTNRTIPELRAHFGPRGFSRLMHGALVLALDGPDWRAPVTS